jgi:ankyrin repeat protein
MYTPKDERTPSESLKKAKELEKSLPISKKEKAAVDALLDMYVLDETKEKEIAMNIDKKSRKIRKRYTSSPSNLVLKLSIEKDGKYKLKRGGKRRNRKTIPLTQYGGSPQNEFYNAVRRAAYDDGVGDMSSIDLLRVFLSRPDINARYLVDSDTSDDDSDTSDNYPNDVHFTALFVCCLIKNPEVVRFLLENGAKLMGQELLALIMHNHFPNPIQEENINLEIATMLLDHEHTYDVNNDTYEVYRGDGADMGGLALRARERALPRESDGTRLAYVNSIYSMNSATALHYAAAKSQPSLVRLLLERGANIDAMMKRGTFMNISPIMFAEDTLVYERMSLVGLEEDILETDEKRRTEINISKLEETISILNKHYAKRNAKQHLVDQMGPPNMKDLEKTVELPRGRRITANTDDYPIEDGDGVIRKYIKSYLGGKKTRRLRRYNKRTLTKDKQDEEELDEMECIARYPYNDESAERMKDCLKN